MAEIRILPLTSTDLVLLPRGREPSVTYQALRAALVQLLLADCLSISLPVPPSYLYSSCLTPHAFTGLPRFVCSRIHQMRTGASHLAAYISGSNRDSSTLCPFCEEEDESLEHAILLCPAKAQPRLTPLSGVDENCRDAPLWRSVPLPEDWLNISTLLAHVSLLPCCVSVPVLLPQGWDWSQTALTNLKPPSLATAFLV